jgi:hypothetical protein
MEVGHMAKKLIREEQKQKQQFWKQHIEHWSRSGSMQSEYCRRHNLSSKSFTYWKKRFRENTISKPVSRQKSPVDFVAVKVNPGIQIAADSASALVLCKDGYRIEIKEGFNPVLLGEVLRTLREFSC